MTIYPRGFLSYAGFNLNSPAFGGLVLNLGLAGKGSWLSGGFSYLRDVLLPGFPSIILCSFVLWGKKTFLLVSAISLTYLVYSCRQWLHYLNVSMHGPLVNAIVTFV